MIVNSIGSYRPAVGTNIRTANTVPQSHQGYQENAPLAFGSGGSGSILKWVLTGLAALGITIGVTGCSGGGGGGTTNPPGGGGGGKTVDQALTQAWKDMGYDNVTVGKLPDERTFVDDTHVNHRWVRQDAGRTNTHVTYRDYPTDENIPNVSYPSRNMDFDVNQAGELIETGYNRDGVQEERYQVIVNKDTKVWNYVDPTSKEVCGTEIKTGQATVKTQNADGVSKPAYLKKYKLDGQDVYLEKKYMPKTGNLKLAEGKNSGKTLQEIIMVNKFKHWNGKGKLEIPVGNGKIAIFDAIKGMAKTVAKETVETMSHIG